MITKIKKPVEVIAEDAERNRFTEKVLCEKSLYDFMKCAWHVLEPSNPFQEAEHIKVICDHLEAVADKRIRKLLVSVPPGHSKSLSVCCFFPAWVWTISPEKRFLFTTYSDTFAMRDSVRTRDIIKSEWYQSHWGKNFRIREDRDTQSNFWNSRQGFRFATSVSGSGTGARADIICADDANKIEEAYQQTARDKVNHWWNNVMSGRGADPRTSCHIVIAQRLHPDDLIGHLLKQGGYEWLYLPMEFDPDRRCVTSIWSDPRKERGDLLWPERFDRQAVEEWKKRLGLYGSAAQLGQNPQSFEGGIFRREYFAKFVKHLPVQARRVRAWDLACLVAGTMIETIAGQVPIEKIKTGDLVLTRQGYKKVEWSGKTKTVDKVLRVVFDNGSSITGTPDHKIWTKNNGWTNIDEISTGCYTLLNLINGEPVCQKQRKKRKEYRLTESFIGDSLEKNIFTLGDSIKNSANMSMSLCIVPFGRFIMDEFQKIMISTIKMVMSTITTFQTLNVYQGRSMLEDTVHLPDTARLQRTACVSIWPEKNNGIISRIDSTNAIFALKSSRLVPASRLNFALKLVVFDTILTSRVNHAKYAILNLSVLDIAAQTNAQINTGLQSAISVEENSLSANRFKNVVASVADRSYIGSEKGIDVYDLTVSDAHEFFANGILVHNSTKDGCHTAGVLMSSDPEGKYYVEDVVRGQWDPAVRDKMILATAYADRKAHGPITTVIEQEPGSAGIDQANAMIKLLNGFEVWSERPTGPKEARAMPFASQMGGGNVYFPEDAHWLQDFREELCSFPKGSFADQVDAASGAFNRLSQATWSSPAVGARPGSSSGGGRFDDGRSTTPGIRSVNVGGLRGIPGGGLRT